MRFVDEYRDRSIVRRYVEALAGRVSRSWTIMEVCGGQTHAIVRFGLDQLLPPAVRLVHGPGCPVCVTPTDVLDTAMRIAARREVIFCSFGDMLRVPGSSGDLLAVKAAGGDVRVVYSPLDALALARANPAREVVFLAVGFETTAPANAMAVYQAKRLGVRNFSLLVSHVLVPPALDTLLASPDNRVQGILAAGHVCAIMGTAEYAPIATRHHVPVVVTGFEPLDILQGIYMCVCQLEDGRAEVETQYTRAVSPAGNPHARSLVTEVFEVSAQAWRGLGTIPASGLALRAAYREHDAAARFGSADRPAGATAAAAREQVCISGLVLQGRRRPPECPAFGHQCTPDSPLGAPMVSSEGACAAYYRYRRQEQPRATG